MSVSESEMDESRYNWLYFHGEDVRTKKFQKKINKKPIAQWVSISIIIKIYKKIEQKQKKKLRKIRKGGF